MLPEAYLNQRDPFAEAKTINATMRRYLDGSVFRTLPHSYVYLERTQSDGKVRRGIMVALDLEAYNYTFSSTSLVLISNRTLCPFACHREIAFL